jgi:uncharacterized membrane protein
MDALYVIGGIVLFVLAIRSHVVRKRDREEDHARWQVMLSRISVLERTVRVLEEQQEKAATTRTAPKTVERPTPAPPSPSLQSAQPFEAASSVVSPQPVLPDGKNLPITTISTSEVAHIGAEFATPRSPETGAPPVPLPAAAATLPSLGLPGWPSQTTFADRIKSSHDLEERLGTNWLNKLGIGILVLGIAFFLAYELKEFGPVGKVLVGCTTGLVLLGGGIWLERKERYRILAWAGIGGGWALLFFTTYAMYHVPAAKVLNSETLDLTVMLAVTIGMVLHTLRYKSQSVTGIAFLLAFLTVSISHSTVYSMTAGALLAAGLAVTVGKMQWFEMEVLGILATYLNHYLWLRPIVEPMHGKRRPFQDFALSAGILAFYWVIYRLSYVLRSPRDKRAENISTAAALLNTVLLLAVFKYQSVHPEFAFWALLVLGAVETLLSQLPVTRKRRTAVLVLATLGVTLLVAAFPFKYSGTRLSVLWLLEAEALLLIGVWTREIVFRRLGMPAMVVVSVQMISVDAARVLGRRMDEADLRADFALSIIFVLAAVLAYVNAHWVLKRWAELFEYHIDLRVIQRFSYAAAVMLATAAWLAFPQTWTAVAWSAVGLGLALAGRRHAIRELSYQANLLGLAAVIRVLSINLGSLDKSHGLSLRLLTVALVSALLYVTSPWSGDPDRGSGITIFQRLFSTEEVAGVAYTWAASGLLGLLAWYELRPVGVADAWLVGGLVLFEIGIAQNKYSLRLQSYLAFLAGCLRIFFVNLNADGNPGEISPRVYSVVPLALGFLYAYWRLGGVSLVLTEEERRFKVSDICCWLGMVTVVALMRFELPGDWVATAWAGLVFALLAQAWRSGGKVFLYQGMLLAAGVAFRTILHNFYERSYFPAPLWDSRWITAGTSVAVLLAALPLAFRLREKGGEIPGVGVSQVWRIFLRRPEQLLFFVPILLLTWLLGIEMRHGMVTLAWGVEGVAVFMLALWLAERSFRLTGLGILLLCVGKILVIDVWRLDPRDRYLTFIVLGAALLLVSFLYTRNREKLRQFL